MLPRIWPANTFYWFLMYDQIAKFKASLKRIWITTWTNLCKSIIKSDHLTNIFFSFGFSELGFCVRLFVFVYLICKGNVGSIKVHFFKCFVTYCSWHLIFKLTRTWNEIFHGPKKKKNTNGEKKIFSFKMTSIE